MKKVIDGTDKGGITEAVGWKGGGKFRYYRLGPSLLEKDQFGNWIINKKYNAAMLAKLSASWRVSPTLQVMKSTGSTAIQLKMISSM